MTVTTYRARGLILLRASVSGDEMFVDMAIADRDCLRTTIRVTDDRYPANLDAVPYDVELPETLPELSYEQTFKVAAVPVAPRSLAD